MSTLTSRMSLKKPDGPDPFDLADFVDNWDKIDAAPGVYICTSSTRPSWGVDQAGRVILETNTRRRLLWTGSAWAEPLVSPGGWSFTQAINAYQAAATVVDYTMGTINLIRPSTVFFIGTIEVSKSGGRPSLHASHKVDDVDISYSTSWTKGYLNQIWGWLGFPQYLTGPAGTTDGGEDIRHAILVGATNLDVGLHTLKTSVTGSPISTTDLYLYRASTLAYVVTANGGQTLL